MASTKQNNQSKQFKLDATRPFYAAVGAADLAVAYGRTAATEAQIRFAKVDLEPKSLRDQAVTLVTSRVDELQSDAKALPTRLEKVVNEYVAELNKSYADLAVRGETFVAKVRGQEATKQTKAAAKTTSIKAKTTNTQAKKSAKKTTTTAKKSATSAARKTTSTAKKSAKPATSSAKATVTSAQKTAESATQAVIDAAEKAGN